MIRGQPYIDLHMHSRYSDDGEFTPEQLVEECQAAGLRIMAITDHNCAKANAAGERAAAQAGIEYISSRDRLFIPGVDLHLFRCTGLIFGILFLPKLKRILPGRMRPRRISG